MRLKKNPLMYRAAQMLLVVVALFTFMGVGDEDARFNDLGHHLMCVCGCSQILLECNHVGCMLSDRMRGELMEALNRGDNDDLALQSFIQKYGTTVVAAPSTSGFGRVAWIMPFVALFAGLASVVFIVRAWRNRPAPALADGIQPIKGAELERYRDQADKETDL
ncbi:MAG TPA: cytochrome c-type biogenesis protein CcmH [Terriglobales bacterium]|jgi:cytochrome c-type biogenesis protein CcmH|nr:cytochrome c-type biogenesis protein CcmH [Terriglobales bacterium]